jgi:hypothetical protein
MRLVAVLVACLTVVSAPAVTRAEDGGPPTLDRNAEAVRRGQEGIEAFAAGDLEAASRAFADAEALAHSPVFLLYQARVRVQAGALEEALDLYARVLTETLSEGAPDAWRVAAAQAKTEADDVRARLAAREAATERAPAPPAPPRTEAARVAALHVEPRAPGAGMRRATQVALVASVAGAVVGVGAGLIALLRMRPVNERCARDGACHAADSRIVDDVKAWSRAADVGFVIAGTGLATAGVLWWLTPTPATGGTVGFGVAATGRF